tara:strand:- start:165 stop:428 length:264 start_codon:yes stop_codon:yes gene_type:complete
MRYKLKEGLTYALLDEEICIFDPNTAEYHNLNSTATFIWQILDKNILSFEEIVDKLLEEYEVERKFCVNQLKTYLDSLLKESLIIEL